MCHFLLLGCREFIFGHFFHLIGMVPDAQLVDIIGDQRPEFAMVGEWMAPPVFAIDNGKLVNTPTKLNEYSRWR